LSPRPSSIHHHFEVEATEGHVEGEGLAGEAEFGFVAEPSTEGGEIWIFINGGIKGEFCLTAGDALASGGAFNEDAFAVFGSGEEDAGIPLGVFFQPEEGFGTHAGDADFGHVFVVPTPVGTNPAVGEDDIGVEKFAGVGVGAAGADGGADVIVQPTDEVVADILGVFFPCGRR